MDEERQVELIKSLADNEQIAAIYGQNAKTVTEIIQAIQDMKICAQNVKKAESPAFMKINNEIVNKKLEEQTTKLDEIVTMLAKLSLNDGDNTAQAYHNQNNGPLVVTRTAEVLPTKEIQGEDLVEVTEVTAGEEETMGIAVDTTEVITKDKMITVVEAAETETTTGEDIIGMETETKMIRETIMTTMTIEKTEETIKQANFVQTCKVSGQV